MITVAFFGTPEFAWRILSWILEYSEIDCKLVVSQPDKAVGRKKQLQHTAVKKVAIKHQIEVLQPEKIKKNREFYEYLQSLELDFIVVVAYGKIMPKSILEIPKFGCVNIHGSILPKYRWASPVQAAVKSWDDTTWLTTMYMSQGMDEGDILQIQKVSIEPNDTSIDIFEKFVDIWPELLKETLEWIVSWDIKPVSQNHSQATYCGKISREDGEVSFQKQTSQEIYNTYRAYTPWPGIYTFFEEKRLALTPTLTQNLTLTLSSQEREQAPGQFIKISKNRYGIICSDKKILEIKQVKLEGKKSMDIWSFVNGNTQALEYIFE